MLHGRKGKLKLLRLFRLRRADGCCGVNYALHGAPTETKFTAKKRGGGSALPEALATKERLSIGTGERRKQEV